MKPRVFLSHSKKDKVFVEDLANKLRIARIDVWYDDWEIPPGESIRKKIFEDGIPNCDVFFVYLTEYSIDSYWVSKELDAMTISEAENRNSQMALFVSTSEVREKLSLDLKAMNIPEFNEREYLSPFSKLLSRIWEVYSKNSIKKAKKENEIEILGLEKDKLQLEKTIVEFQNNSLVDLDKIDQKLKSKTFTSNGTTKSMKELFEGTLLKLADGTNDFQIQRLIANSFGIELESSFKSTFQQQVGFQFHDFIGELILLGLIDIKKPTDEWNQLYYLSEVGLNYGRNK